MVCAAMRVLVRERCVGRWPERPGFFRRRWALTLTHLSRSIAPIERALGRKVV